jgi:hypothetical protein
MQFAYEERGEPKIHSLSPPMHLRACCWSELGGGARAQAVRLRRRAGQAKEERGAGGARRADGGARGELLRQRGGKRKRSAGRAAEGGRPGEEEAPARGGRVQTAARVRRRSARREQRRGEGCSGGRRGEGRRSSTAARTERTAQVNLAPAEVQSVPTKVDWAAELNRIGGSGASIGACGVESTAAEVDSRRRPHKEGRRRGQLFLPPLLPLAPRRVRRWRLWGLHHRRRIFDALSYGASAAVTHSCHGLLQRMIAGATSLLSPAVFCLSCWR